MFAGFWRNEKLESDDALGKNFWHFVEDKRGKFVELEVMSEQNRDHLINSFLSQKLFKYPP